MNDYIKLLLTANKKIALLEAKLQSAQADKLAAIAKERKRWGREDLEALSIRDLEQRAKGVEDLAIKSYSGMTAAWMISNADRLKAEAEALKATQVL